jgi:hypothetical protein
MPHSAPLELLADAHGAITFGWLDEGVLYARFNQCLSAELGEVFAARLKALVAEQPSVRLFGDARALQSYDLAARSAITRVLLAERTKLTSLDCLAWSGGFGLRTRALLASIGRPLYATTDPVAFEERLLSAAPRAQFKIAPVGAGRSAPRMRR